MIEATGNPQPLIRADADLSQIGEMPIEVEALTALKETPPDVFKATVMLWTWAWRQVPPGTLPDADDALAAMAGLRRDVWCRMREQVLAGFERDGDGRLHHAILAAKAVTLQTEAEKRKKRKADDARRQRKLYQRRKLAHENGSGMPEPNAETRKSSSVELPAHAPTSPPPSAPSCRVIEAAPTPSIEPTISAEPHGEPIKSTSNGHALPQRDVQAKPASPAIPAGVEIGTPGYPWDPTTFTDEDWDHVVHRYVISGSWAWRSLGPSPRFPECKAPAFVLRKYGYGQQAT